MVTKLGVLFWESELEKDYLIASTMGEPDRTLARKAIRTINTSLYTLIANQADLRGDYRKAVLNEAIRVLALDKYHETGQRTHKQLADECVHRVRSYLKDDQYEEVRRVERQCFTFFDWEKTLGRRMFHGPNPIDEIEAFTLAKSCDVFIYWTVLNQFGRVDFSVGEELYRQQLLRDLIDDFTDIEEDLAGHQPNPFLLRALHHEQDLPADPAELMSVLYATGAVEAQTAFVQERSQAYQPPQEYEWIRECGHPVPLSELDEVLEALNLAV